SLVIHFWGRGVRINSIIVRIDHLKTFCFGFLFYWVIPLLVASDDPLFTQPDPARMHAYWWSITGICISFIVGDFVGRFLKYSPKPPRKTEGFGLLCFLASAAFLAFVALKRAQIFSGPYIVDSAAMAVRGPLAMLSILLFTIALVRMSAREEF